MTAPKRDLSALTGLRGLRPTPAPAPAPAPAAPRVEEAPAERPRQPRRKAPPKQQGKHGTPVYLAADVKTRMEALAAAAGVTYTEWVLDTLDALYDDLGQAFAPPPDRRSPLPPRRRVVRPRSTASTSVQLRLTDEELAAIDRRRDELGVPSRSAFLARVVELGVAREG